jgi:hypothetical protein
VGAINLLQQGCRGLGVIWHKGEIG